MRPVNLWEVAVTMWLLMHVHQSCKVDGQNRQINGIGE